MTTIKIVTDSTCDLPKEVIEKHGIEIIPLSLTFGDKTYLDGVDITKEEFMDKLKASEDLPKSSQPSAGAFQELYDRLNKEADDVKIISIHITEGMSGTTNAAQTAADMCEADVTVINSRFISQALGFQVVRAAQLAEEGLTVDEIVQYLEEIREGTSLYIMVDTLEYLAKGGRIGKSKAFLGSLLKIKPILSLTDGVLNPVSKVRTHMQMIQQLTTTFTTETKGKIVKKIAISHAEADSVAMKLKQSLQGVTDVKDITIQVTSPIISTHAGPGAVALMYYTESK
ncbi:DegV family protein [Bacillus sp. FJAT-45037]|uniref:DegV family protein n=1 Tax=Bacillus sp. FJAT-45037 TaxID=2011007 RepID=UPI000C238356|nr:DegV family protein [Bacillus sp. FJAT-45037]